MVTIYGADLSPYTKKVRMAAHVLGIEHEYKKVSLKKGETRTAEFLKMHPAGKIPVIDDDGFFLFESNAIIKYFSKQRQNLLYSDDLKQKATIDQWIDFVSLHVAEVMDLVIFNKVIAPCIGRNSDEQIVQKGEGLLHRFLPIVENSLVQTKYLATEQMTLADIVLLASLDLSDEAKINFSNYPKISAWQKDLRAQDFYLRCNIDNAQALKNLQGA